MLSTLISRTDVVSLDLRRASLALIENHVRPERGKNPLWTVWLRSGPRICSERSEFLHLKMSNFNTRSNLIALAEYRARNSTRTIIRQQMPLDNFAPLNGAWCCFRSDCGQRTGSP